jgi:hypothetical protein
MKNFTVIKNSQQPHACMPLWQSEGMGLAAESTPVIDNTINGRSYSVRVREGWDG